MTKGTQLWTGDRMRDFFRAHVRRSTSLGEADAEQLVEALVKAVNFMRVWEMPLDPPLQDAQRPSVSPATPAKKAAPKPVTGGPPVVPPAFNPYAFSAMVVLSKTGKDGLLKKLADIKTAENLKALAEAQHLAIDRSLKKADDLRKAIAAATEQRLADRKAAAS